MKIVTETSSIVDVNTFGETLRKYFFLPHKEYGVYGLGCYSTFDLTENFKALDHTTDEFISMATAYFPEAMTDWDKDGIHIYQDKDNHLIFVMWRWDGDGTLIVSDGDRVAINSDCKKCHGWQFAPYF